MYVIKNISKSDVSIPDLRVTLSSGDQIDLDMITSRFYIDQSSALRRMLNGGSLKCILKDDGSGKIQIKMQEAVASPIDQAAQTSPLDVMNAVKQMEEKLSKRLDERINSQPQIDINAVNQALQALQSIANQASSGQPNKNAQTTKADDTDIVDERVVNIHERTLDRLSSKAESKVKHEEQTTDSNVNKNIQELEGLL